MFVPKTTSVASTCVCVSVSEPDQRNRYRANLHASCVYVVFFFFKRIFKITCIICIKKSSHAGMSKYASRRAGEKEREIYSINISDR